jgi:hypothetical protein
MFLITPEQSRVLHEGTYVTTGTIPETGGGPLVLALSAITVDDMGKNAIRDGLSKIVIKNSGEYGSTSGITFRNGVPAINHRPHVNVDYYEERAKAIQQNLESGI